MGSRAKIKAAAVTAAVGAVICIMINIIVKAVGFTDMTMIGGAGLRNVIADIALKGFASLFAAVSFFIAGSMLLGALSESGRKTPAFTVGAGAAAVIIPIIIFFASYRSDFSMQLYASGNSSLGDLNLLIACVKDYASEFYEAYSVNEFEFTEKGSYYSVTGYFNEDINGVNCKWEFFRAQIGKKDYEKLYFSETNNNNAEAYVTLYINSGFIRSFEETETNESAGEMTV